ncbi:MAG: asparagine synthase-related protein [Candidatus Aenigmatarchaeota archaeon]
MPEVEKVKLFNEKVGKNNLERVKGKNKINEILHGYSYMTMLNGFLSDSFPSMHQEIVNPFMDKKFLDYCYRIPPHIKIKNFESRFLMKKMMRNKLPDYIIKRGRDSWSKQTRSIVKDNKEIFYRFANRLQKRKILKNNVNSFSKRYKYKLDEKLWSLLTLEVLFELFIDNNYRKEPPVLENLL